MARPLTLGIAGGTGSGKTTIANAVVEALGGSCVRLDHDSYYLDQGHLPLEERREINFDHPDALDNALLAQHLEALHRAEPVEKPIYDFVNHVRLDEATRLEPAPVIVVEGILTLAIPMLRDRFDVRIFVDTDADIRLMRRIRRDLEQRGREFADIRQQYYSTVRPMHMAFVEPSKRYANLIIPEGGENRIAIDFVIARIRHYLSENASPLK